MRRTAWKVVENHDQYGTFTAEEKITCEVTGEMDTGTKVWTELKTGEQFLLFRMQGLYYFCHI